jgi:hypothetical protein
MCDKGVDVTWSYKAHKVSRIWPFASLRLTLHGCAEAQAWPCRSSCFFVHAAVQVEKVPDAMLSVVCNESLAVRTQGTRILVLQNATRSTSNLFNRSCHTFGKISSRSSYVKYTVYHSVLLLRPHYWILFIKCGRTRGGSTLQNYRLLFLLHLNALEHL